MYVYTYYVPELNAIKIGHGSNPEARMDSYSYAHGFTPDHSSLRTWYCGANDPRTLEGYVHNKIGLRRLQYQSQYFLMRMPTICLPHHSHWLSTTSRLRLASERMADSSAGVGFLRIALTSRWVTSRLP